MTIDLTKNDDEAAPKLRSFGETMSMGAAAKIYTPVMQKAFAESVMPEVPRARMAELSRTLLSSPRVEAMEKMRSAIAQAAAGLQPRPEVQSVLSQIPERSLLVDYELPDIELPDEPRAEQLDALVDVFSECVEVLGGVGAKLDGLREDQRSSAALHAKHHVEMRVLMILAIVAPFVVLGISRL